MNRKISDNKGRDKVSSRTTPWGTQNQWSWGTFNQWSWGTSNQSVGPISVHTMASVWKKEVQSYKVQIEQKIYI